MMDRDPRLDDDDICVSGVVILSEEGEDVSSSTPSVPCPCPDGEM